MKASSPHATSLSARQTHQFIVVPCGLLVPCARSRSGNKLFSGVPMRPAPFFSHQARRTASKTFSPQAQKFSQKCFREGADRGVRTPPSAMASA